jgi:hypothetical protein
MGSKQRELEGKFDRSPEETTSKPDGHKKLTEELAILATQLSDSKSEVFRLRSQLKLREDEGKDAFAAVTKELSTAQKELEVCFLISRRI